MAIGNDAKIQLIIMAQNQMGGAFTSAGTMIQGLESKAVATTGILGGLGAKLAGLAAAAVTALGGFGVKLNMEMEQTQMAFETMLGSAQKAEAFMNQLKDMATATPFEFPDLANTSRKLLAFGFAVEKIPEMLTAVGDAASGLGLGAAGMERISIALGQMRAKAKVSGDEMLQLTEAGVPAWEILAKAIGKSTAEVMKLSEKGKIPANFAIDALTKGMEARFKNMMQKQSLTLGGQWSTLLDNSKRLLTAGTAPLAEGFRLLFARINDWLTPAVKVFEKVMNDLRPVLRELWAQAGNLFARLGDLFRGFWSVAGGSSVAGSKAKGFAEALRRALTIIKEVNQELMRMRPTFEAIGAFFGAIAMVIKSQVEVAFIGLKTTLKVIVDLLNGDFKKAWSDLKQGAKDMGMVMNDLETSLKPLPGSIQAIAIALGSVGTLLLGGAVWKGLQKFGVMLAGLVGGAELTAWLSMAVGSIWTFVKTVGKAGAFGTLVSEIGTLLVLAGEAILAAIGGWPILIGVALLAIGTAVFVYWDDIKRYTSGLWTSLKGYWDEGVMAIQTSTQNSFIGWLANQIYSLFTNIKSDVSMAWEAIKNTFGIATSEIQLTMSSAWNQIKLFTSEVWPQIQTIISAVWDVIKSVIGLALAAIVPQLKTAWTAIKSAVKIAWDLISGIIKTAWDLIKDTVKLGWDVVTGIIKIGLDILSGDWDKVWGDFTELIKNVWDDIGNLIGNAINNIIRTVGNLAINIFDAAVNIGKSFVNGLIEGAKGIDSALTSSASKTVTVTVPKTNTGGTNKGKLGIAGRAGLAIGGIVTRPTEALIGEGGEPEAVIPLSKAREMGFGGGGSTVINVYANGNITRNERELGEIVSRVLMDRLKLQKQFSL